MFNSQQLSDLVLIFVLICIIVKVLLSFPFGTNRKLTSIKPDLVKLKETIETSSFTDITKHYYSYVKSLGKPEYDVFKFLGIPKVSIATDQVSKGVVKLMQLIKMSGVRPRGKVLDLCSGRGGWDCVCAKIPDVKQIISVTLGPGPGHQGHEEYTKKPFEGREKVLLLYADATELPCYYADTVLFDGGEQKTDKVKEADVFWNLFSKAVPHQIGKETDFILKILTPTDPRIIKALVNIQNLTGKGNYYRPPVIRNSSLELYFISTPSKGNLEASARALISKMMGVAILGGNIPDISLQYNQEIPRQKILNTQYKNFSLEVLTPLDLNQSIKQISQYKTPDVPTRYLHWNSLGTYMFGNSGSKTINQIQKAMLYINHILPSLPGFQHWKVTDTTAEGFQEIFKEKVDASPLENTPYDSKRLAIYSALALYFKQRGFSYRELSYAEVERLVNKKGVSSVFDGDVLNIADFLKRKNWQSIVENTRKYLEQGTPINGIFTTIGKREKKKTMKKTKGSRMVAFLPISMRILELKIFGRFINLTKPNINKMGVGGLGLHDYGMRLHEVWKGRASSSDIAGFDTKVSVKTLSMEHHFCKLLGANNGLVKNMFRLYAYPHILVPKIGKYTRMELLKGFGQRMSGTQITYPFNTFTRLVLTILQYGESQGWELDKYFDNTVQFMKSDKVGGCISGDDEIFTASPEELYTYAKFGKILNEAGFIRKDVNPLADSTVHITLEEVEFCSHNYEKVTYLDEEQGIIAYRYMPTRDVTEIISKSTLRIGGDGLDSLTTDAWIAMQGLNLLVLYHHLRLPRLIGSLYRTITPQNLILTDFGGTFLPKPWLRDGDMLDVINTVLFGQSTAYPRPGFRVRQLSHLGFLDMSRNRLYDDFEGTLTRKKCKILLLRRFVTQLNLNAFQNIRMEFIRPYLDILKIK